MLPVRVFSIASPPPATLFATRTAAADATTYTMPMNASCGTRWLSRCEVRVTANNSAPTAVASRANAYAQVESASTWIRRAERPPNAAHWASDRRSEEHTSELQSHHDLVCRLLLEKKKAEVARHLQAILSRGHGQTGRSAARSP